MRLSLVLCDVCVRCVFGLRVLPACVVGSRTNVMHVIEHVMHVIEHVHAVMRMRDACRAEGCACIMSCMSCMSCVS